MNVQTEHHQASTSRARLSCERLDADRRVHGQQRRPLHLALVVERQGDSSCFGEAPGDGASFLPAPVKPRRQRFGAPGVGTPR